MSNDTDIMPGIPRQPSGGALLGAPFKLGHGTPLAGHGCVCPVGAEATCKGPLCPRRPIGPAA